MKYFLLFIGIGLMSLDATEASTSTQTSLDGSGVAINGVRMTVADVERKNPGTFFQARNSFYEAQK